LVYSSRSLQASSISPDYPRVILFGENSNLTLAFTGNPALPSYNDLEAIEFDPQSSRFSLRMLHLPGSNPSERLQVAEANPARCVVCHRPDPKSIWNSYDLWPGAYGSNDDVIYPGRSRRLWQSGLAVERLSSLSHAYRPNPEPFSR